MEQRQPLSTSMRLFIISGVCFAIFALWLIFNFILRISANIEFDNCDKQVNTSVVSVNVSMHTETRRGTSGSGRHNHTYRYTAYVYSASYNGVNAEYATKYAFEDYSGLSDAVYLNGVLWWHGKELNFGQLSVMSFPNYSDEKAYDPHDAGVAAICDEVLSKVPAFKVLSMIGAFGGLTCLALGSIFRKKGM